MQSSSGWIAVWCILSECNRYLKSANCASRAIFFLLTKLPFYAWIGLADREAAAPASEMDKELSHDKDQPDGESQIQQPAKKARLGRPTTSRDKPPYEEKVKKSRFCTICKEKGHKSTTYPTWGDAPKAPHKLPKCSNCGVIGHRKNACEKPVKTWEVPFL